MSTCVSEMSASDEGAIPALDLRLADDGLLPERGLLALGSSMVRERWRGADLSLHGSLRCR